MGKWVSIVGANTCSSLSHMNGHYSNNCHRNKRHQQTLSNHPTLGFFFWQGFGMSLKINEHIFCRSILMTISSFSKYFSLHLFNLNFRQRILFYLIDFFFVYRFCRHEFGPRANLGGFHFFLSLNPCVNSLLWEVLPLAMLIVM